MVVFGQSGCIRAKWLYSGKMVIFFAKVVVFVQKRLYLRKSGCFLAKVAVFGQSECIPANWLFLAKVVVFGQFGCDREKMLHSGKSGCIRTKWLYSGKSCCIRKNWLYSGRAVVFGKG